jgi:hypothetical protein
MRRAEGGAKNFGVFRVKNHDFTLKNQIFSNGGGRHENLWAKGFDRTYQALSRESPGFGTGNNQFNHPHHPPFMYPFFSGFNPGMVRF